MKVQTKNINDYVETLKLFNGKSVIATDSFGKLHEGKIIAISHQHLNIVLDSREDLIILKNPQVIKLKK